VFYADGRKYDGEFQQGQIQGYGTMEYPNGETYKGEWKRNLRHGHGTVTAPDGEKYEGEWRGDVIHGRGKYVHFTGETYEGEWDRGRRHGYGTMVSYGNKYTGQWKENETWDHGTIEFSNGDKYTGQWNNGEMNGQGKMVFANADMYEGEWKVSTHVLHGQGKASKSRDKKRDGTYYVPRILGQRGEMHGQGTMQFTNGDSYEGEWREDKRHGQGTYTYAGGGWSSSEWYKGAEQTPTAVETLLQKYRLEAFLQPILDIGVYAPLDMLPIVSDDLVSMGMQAIHIKQFKRLCDSLRLRQVQTTPSSFARLRSDFESDLAGGAMPRPRGRHFAHNNQEEL